MLPDISAGRWCGRSPLTPRARTVNTQGGRMTGTSPRRWRLYAVTATVLLVACTPTGTNANPSVKAGGKVTVASWQEQDSLLACNITAAASHACAYINPAMEGLLTVKANQDIPRDPKLSDYWVPELATEVPTLENGDVKVSGDKMDRSEEHTSELQSQSNLVCRLLLETKQLMLSSTPVST